MEETQASPLSGGLCTVKTHRACSAFLRPCQPCRLCVAGILHPCCVCFWTWLTIVSLAVSRRRIYEGPLSLPGQRISQEPGINRHWARHLWKRNRNIWIRNCHRDINAISVQSMAVILMDGFGDGATVSFGTILKEFWNCSFQILLLIFLSMMIIFKHTR